MHDPLPQPMTLQQAYELAVERMRAGDSEQAESLARQILRHQPGHPAGLHLMQMLATAHFQSGNSFSSAGNRSQAMAAYRRALAIQPDHIDARFNLANLLRIDERLDEAVSEYRALLTIRPDDLEACNNLGSTLVRQRRHAEAIEAFRQALRARPTYAGAWSNLGKALEDSGKTDDAIDAYHRAIQYRPDFADAHFNLGNALRSKDDLDGAIGQYRLAAGFRPNHAATWNNLGNALKDGGRLDEAISCYRQAWDLGADARAAGNLLYGLHLHPDYDATRIYDEHVRWNDRYARPLAPAAPSYPNHRSPDRRLRIGYVSADFNAHPVGRFMLPVLSHHDRRRVEIFCYDNVKVKDDLTAALRLHADVWQETSNLPDADLASQIHQDRIDILVDLSLHTGRNRLLTFARKPAPVQATYLSYPGTSGLETMDYRLTDPYLDPPSLDQDRSVYSEKSVRLRTYWCYQPPGDAPAVAPPPALNAGYVTFGCFNQFCKISRPAWDLWCTLLHAVPGSRMLLLAPQGSSRELARGIMANHGIDPGRLEFVGRAFMGVYLERHRLIDIALDPFPFTGGTTTCDALWMGVPVITLRGATAVGRGGASILSHVGLTDLIAEMPEQYVRIAAALANDLPQLSALRSSMRQRMQASPLMDAAAFARNLEEAYRKMWSDWCTSNG
jgi:protein O-GlcNAc transferase